MEKYKILIVDDSAITRGILEKAFNESDSFEVLASLSNGRKAIDYCNDHQVDLVISDYDMPEINGSESIKFLTGDFGIPVIIYSDNKLPQDECISCGAAAFFVKPHLSSYSGKDIQNFIAEISACVKKIAPSIKSSSRQEIHPADVPQDGSFAVLCIGASTGGPNAVREVLLGLGNDFPLPVLYTQHIDEKSDEKMVRWFNSECPNMKVVLAQDGVEALPGIVYMAPAETHLVVDYVKENGHPVLHLSDEPPERFLKPAVNKLFKSAARHYGNECLAVLMTGMGRDGAEGCKEIVDKGGFTIAEDKTTCAVFGMPAAAIELNAAKIVLPRGKIAEFILRMVNSK